MLVGNLIGAQNSKFRVNSADKLFHSLQELLDNDQQDIAPQPYTPDDPTRRPYVKSLPKPRPSTTTSDRKSNTYREEYKSRSKQKPIKTNAKLSVFELTKQWQQHANNHTKWT